VIRRAGSISPSRLIPPARSRILTMSKSPAPTLSVLADLRPTDDSAASIRAAIARADAKHSEVSARRGELASSIPHLTLETDDDAHLDLVEADVRSADRDEL
jgi:hypothetical protein